MKNLLSLIPALKIKKKFFLSLGKQFAGSRVPKQATTLTYKFLGTVLYYALFL